MAERGCYPIHGRDRIVFAMSAREDLIRRRPERGSYSLLSGGRIVLYWGVDIPRETYRRGFLLPPILLPPLVISSSGQHILQMLAVKWENKIKCLSVCPSVLLSLFPRALTGVRVKRSNWNFRGMFGYMGHCVVPIFEAIREPINKII